MFVVILDYLVDLARIDEALDRHVAWLNVQYEDGVFVASGRREPRVGGVILAAHTTRDDLHRRLELDPFKAEGLAQHTVIEFIPSRTAAGSEVLLT